MWCIGKIDEEYVANMEDVLALYEEPIDPERPRLCFDERPCLMVSNVSEPLPMSDKRSKRLDYEYKRLEPAVILLAYNMDTGQRHLSLCSTKTKIDYATFLGEVITNHYADAKSIRLVQDNLGTHTKGSFYKVFNPEVARKFTSKLEFHFTPKHGSWLNMAEIEFSSLSRQCLNTRFDSLTRLETEAKAWEMQRNEQAVKIHWSFTLDAAREKLKKHYPAIHKEKQPT